MLKIFIFFYKLKSLASFQNSDFYKIPRCRSVEHTPMNPIYTHSDRNNYNGAGTGYVSQPHRVSLHDQSHRFHTAEQPRSITPSYQLQAAPSFVNADHHHFRRSSTPHQNQQNSSPRVDHKKVLDSFTRLMQISSDSKSMNNGGVNNPLEMQNNFPNMRHPSGHSKIHGTTSSQRGAYNGNFVPQNYSAPLNSPAMIIDTNFCGFCKNNGESDKVYKVIDVYHILIIFQIKILSEYFKLKKHRFQEKMLQKNYHLIR